MLIRYSSCFTFNYENSVGNFIYLGTGSPVCPSPCKIEGENKSSEGDEEINTGGGIGIGIGIH